jgi:outer membrane protein assembly factor BamB
MKTSLCVATLLAATSSLFAADWPGYRGPNHDASVPNVTLGDTLAFEEIWKVPYGNGFSQIAIAGGKAYGFIQRGEDEVAVCRDGKTGKEIWAAKIDTVMHDKNGGDGPRSTPAIDGNHVYIYGTHNKLACLDLATGKEVWQHAINSEFGDKELQWGNASSPVIVDDMVIVTGDSMKGGGKAILAFDKNTGTPAWSTTGNRATHATPTVATILGKIQVICFLQSGLVSVDPKTGDTLWTFQHPYKTSTAASPVVGGKNGDIVYCSAGYQVGAAACRISKDGDKWTAEKLWRTEKQNCNHWSTPVYRDGYIYGLFGQNGTPASDGGDLACVDIETGAVKWAKHGIGSQGALILVGDKLLIQTPRGDLLMAAASPDGFKQLGRQNILQGKNWTAPAFANGYLFVRNTAEGEAPAQAACLKLN